MTRPPAHIQEDVVPTEHLADERLVDLALDDVALAHEREHLAACTVCRDAVTSLSRTADLTREAASVELVTPGPELWSRITADLDDPEADDPAGSRDQVPAPDQASVPAALRSEAAPDVAVLPPAPTGASTSPEVVVPLRPADGGHGSGRRRPALGWLAAACAAGILVGAGGIIAADRLREPAVDPSRTVATAELDTLDTAQRLGTATVSERADAVTLEVSARDLRPADGGYVEVWLINRDLQRMVSVGVLDEGRADQAFPISRRLLDEGYVIVDLSREQFDDKPQHSGDSLVRGSLTTRT
jgi:hypothetical protein